MVYEEGDIIKRDPRHLQQDIEEIQVEGETYRRQNSCAL